MLTKVLLINPPTPFLAFANAAPHLGIGYLISYLRDNGIEADYLNLELTNPSDIDVPVGYDFYGVTSVIPQYYFAKLVLQKIKADNLGKTIIGGACASLLPDLCLNDEFDYVVKGYGEKALLSIVKEEHQSGSIIQGSVVENLDSLSFPAWDELLKNNYNASYGNKIAHIFSARGCPYRCYYCCSPNIYGTSVRYRSIENVIAEVTLLKMKYNIDSLYFFDPTFTLNRERTIKLVTTLEPFGLDWTCQTRVDKIDEKLLALMKKSGCNQISFGVEAGSYEVHGNLGKETTVDQNTAAIKMAHNVGMRVKTFLMGALPDDNWDTVKRFKDFITDNRPDSWLYSTFIPFPGTDYWVNPDKYGIKIRCTDLRAYYPLGINARGPVNIDNKYLNRDGLIELRDDMLNFLRKEIPNARVEEAINAFPKQKQILEPFFAGLNTKYVF